MSAGQHIEMAWNVGVLIIGSLYWDTKDGREEWRRKQLTPDSEALVRVPICYGRWSSGRKAHTMVFAPSLPRQSFGTGRVVQCRAPISSAAELVLEARQLWGAERKCASPPAENEPQISADWGCVALVVNPKFLGQPDLADSERVNRRLTLGYWSEIFCEEWERRKALEQDKSATRRREGNSPSSVYAGRSGTPAAVDDNGLLRIEWPELAEGGSLGHFDLLLATATTPTCDAKTGAYPSVDAVAKGWNENKAELCYFTRNRDHGITTYQDAQIKDLLA